MNQTQSSEKYGMAPESIRVSVNGEIRELNGPETVAGLLAQLRLPAERIAIELNKTMVRKRDWDSTLVTDGALIEIVEFVGGG